MTAPPEVNFAQAYPDVSPPSDSHPAGYSIRNDPSLALYVLYDVGTTALPAQPPIARAVPTAAAKAHIVLLRFIFLSFI